MRCPWRRVLRRASDATFAFGPVPIPEAPTLRIYVTPFGQSVKTEPADLAERAKLLERGY